MLDALLFGLCCILAMILGIILGYYKCIKDIDNHNFEKRWEDCE